jgi:hypothetical protein
MVKPFRISQLVLLFILCWPLPTPVQASERLSAAAPQVAAGPRLPVAFSLDRIFSPIERFLGNRHRMIQFAVIGVCIGLYILMRR